MEPTIPEKIPPEPSAMKGYLVRSHMAMVDINVFADNADFLEGLRLRRADGLRTRSDRHPSGDWIRNCSRDGEPGYRYIHLALEQCNNWRNTRQLYG
jgi:hypothetical protein